MGTEYWILKCAKLISNTEKQRLKIQSRGQTLKNTILKTKTKNLRTIYEVHFKNRVKKTKNKKIKIKIGSLFFCKVTVKWK